MGTESQHRFPDGGPTEVGPAGRHGSSSRALTDVHGRHKPMLRGRLHAVAFVVAIPAGAHLVATAGTGLARVAAVVYATSLVALFGASAAYHRLGRAEPWQHRLRRLDHASIYVLIAGSYTPLCLLILPGTWRWGVLGTIWASAALGVAMKLRRFHFARLGSVLYLVMGWAALVTLPLLVSRLSAEVLVLLAAGGVVYSLGALVLARKRPDPWPLVFGYHEIWHTMVVVAGACHYAVNLSIVRTS